MVNFKKWGLALAAVSLMLYCNACSDSTLNQIAKFEADLNAACATTFTVVAGASTTNPQLVSTQDAAAIIGVLVQIEQANKQAQVATAQISTLSAANQANLLNVLMPIQTAINNSVANGTLGIKDAATKQKVQVALVTIQSIVNAGIALIQGAKTA